MDKVNYNKLTDSAREALDTTMQEVVDQILERAYKNALSRNTADKEISLRDIIEAKEDILFQKELPSKDIDKRKRLSSLLAMSGAVYATFGIVYYLIQNKQFDVKADLGLIIAAAGILISIIAFYYNQLLIRRKPQEIRANNQIIIKSESSEFEIVRRWQIIERLVSEKMIKDGQSENKSRSINFILNYLSSEILDKSKAMDLKEILLARNQIVHGEKQFSKYEKENLLEKADAIIETIEKRKH